MNGYDLRMEAWNKRMEASETLETETRLVFDTVLRIP